MKLRRLLSICIVVSFILGMSACSNDSGSNNADTNNADTKGSAESAEEAANSPDNSTASSEDIIEITFYEHSDSEDVAKALVDAFNAQSTNIKVNLSIISNEDYDDKIKVMLSGGGDVDCLWIRDGAQARQLASNGALMSISDLIEANDVDISVYGNMANAYVIDNQTYGLCTSKSCWLLWYNKDLFDEAGMDYPINLTWEEYTNLALSLKTEENWGAICPVWTMNLGASSAGEYLSDESLTKTKDYVAYLERWYVTEKSHPSVEEMQGSFDINGWFAEGSTYMMINGNWVFAILPGYDPQFTWCAAPLPVFEGVEEGATIGNTACYSIAANSKNPEAAFEFLKFACYSDEGAIEWARNSLVPAYPSDAALEKYQEIVTTPGTEYVFSAKVGLEQGLEANYSEINTAYLEEMKDFLVGNGSLEKAFENFNKRRDEINSR